MLEIIFLISLAMIWILFAVVQDLKTREIANWLNFSLIIFALGFRLFYSIFSQNDFSFFYQGLIGLGIFFILGNIFYYGKLFAGGDAKLLISLGAILPFTGNFSTNVRIFAFFLLIFFFIGALYTLTTSIFIGIKHRHKLGKEFKKQFIKNRKITLLSLTSAILIGLAGLTFYTPLIYFAIIIFILPYIYIYAKSVDESCMIVKVKPKDLREGDWLYKDVSVKGEFIVANWDGLSKKEITLLKKTSKEVQIRQGVPFSPVFFISFILLVLFYKWILVWNFFF